jgi:LacI family transcriptional regulator
MTRRPTIHDVARAAGVSKSTVSLVFQKNPVVRAETRALVLRAIEDLGYVYNRNAANLRSARPGLIGQGVVGLILPDLREAFCAGFATTLQVALAQRGYTTLIANTLGDPALQAQSLAALIDHGISALVIAPLPDLPEDTFAPLRRAGLPVLQVLHRAAEDLPFIAATGPLAGPDGAGFGLHLAETLLAWAEDGILPASETLPPARSLVHDA